MDMTIISEFCFLSYCNQFIICCLGMFLFLIFIIIVTSIENVGAIFLNFKLVYHVRLIIFTRKIDI